MQKILCFSKQEMIIFSYPTLERIGVMNYPEGVTPAKIPSVSAVIDPETEDLIFLGSDRSIYRVLPSGEAMLLFSATRPEPPEVEHQEYSIVSRDGKSVPVHRFIPKQPRKTAIMLLVGGPGGPITIQDPTILRMLRAGYEIVMPAYRGCSGYGKEYENSNIGEYGRADVWDVLEAGISWKQKYGQWRQLALAGFSYGGYLAYLALTYPEAPWSCGIVMWGVTKLSRMGSHAGRAYPADVNERAKAIIERSPMKQASKITLPLLILHGAKDTLTSNEDVTQIHESVSPQGVHCELVIYEKEGHGLERVLDEVQQHIKRFTSE